MATKMTTPGLRGVCSVAKTKRRRAKGSGNIHSSVGCLDSIQKEADSPDEDVTYSIAVDCILTALDGLWFTSDDYGLEADVNDHVQSMKRKIQEML